MDSVGYLLKSICIFNFKSKPILNGIFNIVFRFIFLYDKFQLSFLQRLFMLFQSYDITALTHDGSLEHFLKVKILNWFDREALHYFRFGDFKLYWVFLKKQSAERPHLGKFILRLVSRMSWLCFVLTWAPHMLLLNPHKIQKVLNHRRPADTRSQLPPLQFLQLLGLIRRLNSDNQAFFVKCQAGYSLGVSVKFYGELNLLQGLKGFAAELDQVWGAF